jgi:hypothetical protein
MTSADSGNNGRHEIGNITRSPNRRQREPHGAVFARRVNSLKAQLERDGIASQGQVDGLPRQCLGFPVKHSFDRQGGSISRPSRTAGRVAGSALPEPARLLFACIIR